MKLRTALLVTTITTTSATAVLADGHGEDSSKPTSILAEFIDNGTPYLDARYRFEFIDQDSLADDAYASTLRTRVGFKTGEYNDFSGVIEFENVTQIGSDNYNDTLNGRTTHPTVVDVEGTEVNQAFVQYSGLPDTRLRVGRERVNLDNQRFIGSVGWRQNDQTFDMANIVNTSLPDTTLMYGYIDNVNRIHGDESTIGNLESSAHLFNIQNKSFPKLGTLTAYNYLLDIDDLAAQSSNTYGASLKGKFDINDKLTFNYYLEGAVQSDAGDNTTNYDASYYHIAPGLTFGGLTITAGYEVLGSDNGTIAFTTPLATGHKFNGWMDKFLTTPANGLEDIYVSAKYKVKGLDGNLDMLNGTIIKAEYHEFSADEGSADYGSEWGVYTKIPYRDHYYIELKYAQYDADTVSSDTEKFVLGLGVKY